MTYSPPSWGVVATVREPAALLVAFAAYHLDMGAKRIHLYLDAPNPELRVLIGDDPRISLIDATQEFYVDDLNRRRPPGINRRQIVNAAHAEMVTDVDWLFHLDADEYLTRSDPAAELAQLPGEIMALLVPNGERVYAAGAPITDVFDGDLILPVPNPAALARLRGPEMNRFSRQGLMGYTRGKSAVRVGKGFAPGIHEPSMALELKAAATDLLVCHFDGLTRLHWALKMMRHIENNLLHDAGRGRSDYRTEQLRAVRDAGGDLNAIEAFHDRLRLIGSQGARKMRARGWMLDTDVDPGAAIRRQFPGLAVDLSIAAFDAQLHAEFPKVSPPAEPVPA